MSGKHLLIVYHSQSGSTEAMAQAVIRGAGHDGSGAVASIERIVTGLKWKAIQPPLVVAGSAEEADFLPRCEELGMTMAAGLDAGVF